MSLAGKTMVVTGGAGGIGKALVKALTGSASSQLPSVRIDVIDDCL